MKKLTTILTALALVLSLGFCKGGTSLSQEEVKEAFAVTLGATLMASFGSAFGQEMEGVSFDEEKNELTFTKFDLSEFDLNYKEMSGTAAGTNGTMKVDVTLSGGTAKKISYEVGDLQSGKISAEVKVNGKTYSIEFTEEDQALFGN